MDYISLVSINPLSPTKELNVNGQVWRKSHRYFLSGKQKEWEIAKFCIGSVNGINEGGLAMNIGKVV